MPSASTGLFRPRSPCFPPPHSLCSWSLARRTTSDYSSFVEVTRSVWSIIRSLDRAAQVQRRAAARSTWGPVHLGLLNLAAQRPVRPSEVTEELDVQAQSVSRAASELATAGLIERVGDERDGRSYRIALTSEGESTVDRFRSELASTFARHLQGWTEDEITDFARRLTELTTSMAEDLTTEPRERRRNPWRTR
ncbi:winged helix DNA-binding protein [Pseudonocardia sp. EV170527-09]|nr:winged helix DNA-binding protein [Pseudonocardia sp. EV170527-09]